MAKLWPELFALFASNCSRIIIRIRIVRTANKDTLKEARLETSLRFTLCSMIKKEENKEIRQLKTLYH